MVSGKGFQVIFLVKCVFSIVSLVSRVQGIVSAGRGTRMPPSTEQSCHFLSGTNFHLCSVPSHQGI